MIDEYLDEYLDRLEEKWRKQSDSVGAHRSISVREVLKSCANELAAARRGANAAAEEEEAKRDAWLDFESSMLTDGTGYATASIYKSCYDAFISAWPRGAAAARKAATWAFKLAIACSPANKKADETAEDSDEIALSILSEVMEYPLPMLNSLSEEERCITKGEAIKAIKVGRLR